MRSQKINLVLSVKEIRRVIFERQGRHCLWCDKELTWNQLHMHEKIPRGKGGKISLDNSIGLCYDCHLNNAHGDRKSQFKKMVDNGGKLMVDSKSRKEDKNNVS